MCGKSYLMSDTNQQPKRFKSFKNGEKQKETSQSRVFNPYNIPDKCNEVAKTTEIPSVSIPNSNLKKQSKCKPSKQTNSYDKVHPEQDLHNMYAKYFLMFK